MKRVSISLLLILSFLFVQAQPKIKNKKYPSLLWEISGNGLKKPSYLFGTMHVSSKVAFHLADSFYLGIHNADVVALETNPESWQEDMDQYELDYQDDYNIGKRWNGYMSIPNDYLSINTLKFFNYNKKIERSLYSNPSVINNLLYRSYGNESSDFEEDTYLDMYIYQCGKKWGKKIAGVEKYGESMRLMSEAYKDASKDKNKKERSYDVEEGYSQDKIQEAYRSGNLDLLDSINRYNSFSEAFDEKFLFRRNEIQANSIDSILKNKSSLFVGVGAAHLPGNRGVIELLRQKGYKLRPVNMGERDSKDKDQVEKIRVPVSFNTQTADDDFFKVDIPGKFYKSGDDDALDQRQFADMANGSYYMVTRIMTNAWMWGHTEEDVFKKVDSLLYENIPGKILNKQIIYKNGFKGLDVTNRTRRGDIQRYNIFVTPFEIIFFKMSGNSDYVKNGDEAKKFFNSIRFKEYSSIDPVTAGWKTWSPSFGGFSVELPHEPYIGNDGSWIFDAEDRSNKTHYRIVRSDIHNYHFAEEDTFDLRLMEESFAASEFISKQESRKLITYKGYPALDCKFRDKKGNVYLSRFIIQGPHYYSLIAQGQKETEQLHRFFNSFTIKPFSYGQVEEKKDTSLYYSVNTSFYPEEKKQKLDMPQSSYSGVDEDDDEEASGSGIYRNQTISNDSTGEKIYVSFFRLPDYYYSKDTLAIEKDDESMTANDSDWLVRSQKKYETGNKIKVSEKILSGNGSSRMIWMKNFYKDGKGYSLVTEIDTLNQPSSFIKNFFESFHPIDTLKGIDPLEKKSTVFFHDLFSNDSAAHKKAVKGIDGIDLDSTDLPLLTKAISSLGWKEKKYLDIKTALIGKLSGIKTSSSADYLKNIYYAAADTIELQYVALENLLRQQTSYSFNAFRDIITNEPPVLGLNSDNYGQFRPINYSRKLSATLNYDNESFLDELYDSLQLTRTILPNILPLLNLNDYKEPIMNLLKQLVDSGLVASKDYETYFNKFLIEAKQELKKQNIAEKKKEIEKAEEEKREEKTFPSIDKEKDFGNEDLNLYATLLLPFWEDHSNVQPFIQQMLRSNDKRLKYNTLLLLIRQNKPYPDSLLKYFAGLDDYRYKLYKDLKEMKKQEMFPFDHFNQIDLCRSKLLNKKTYDKPDSLVYIDKVETEYKNKKGFIYFFKYKEKKDDLSWKLATAGLVPADPAMFEYEDSLKTTFRWIIYSDLSSSYNRYDLTKFSDVKIKDDEALAEQINKMVKKLVYAGHKSAKEFYEDADKNEDDYDIGSRLRIRY